MLSGFFGNLIFAIIARMLCGNHLSHFIESQGYIAGKIRDPVIKVSRLEPARKAIRKTSTRLFFKAGLFICCKGNKKVSGLSRSGPQRILPVEAFISLLGLGVNLSLSRLIFGTSLKGAPTQ